MTKNRFGSLNEPDMRCFLETTPNGNPFVINITEGGAGVLENTYYQCNPTDSFEEGDPWCDYSLSSDPVEYSNLNNRCESPVPEVCDYSSVSGGVVQGSTEFACDTLVGGGGLDSWGLYNDACVRDSTPNIYSQACCFAYSIDDFDVYDNELSEGQTVNGIRVY